MTLASTESKAIYGGNGSTKAFAISFMFVKDGDIEVFITDVDGDENPKTISTDYTLSGAGNSNGGVCTMNEAPALGETLAIRRNPAIVQETDYVENDAFPAASHEAALDKLTMICQALAERLDRSITFRVTSAVTGVNFPEPEPGKMLSWNEAGDNFENKTLVELGVLALPVSVANGGTGSGSVSDALAVFGLTKAVKADQTAKLEKGYTVQPVAMVTDSPTPATGALQTIDTSAGDVALGAPGAAGVIRFVVFGSGALNPSAVFDSIDGTYNTGIGLAQGEIVSDGTHHFLTIVNGVVAA